MKVENVDLVENSKYTSSSSGREIDRVFIVSEVRTGKPHERQYMAERAQGIPRPGSFHPSIPRLVCESLEVEALGAETFRIVAHYKPITSGGSGGSNQPLKDFAIVRVGASLVQVVTNRRIRTKDDSKDDPCLLEVSRYTNADKEAGTLRSDLEKSAEIQKLVPVVVVSVSQKESANPAQKSFLFTGKINAGNFSGFPEKTVLCTRIEGQSSDGEETFDCTYEFQYNPNGWRSEVYYVDDSNIPLKPSDEFESTKNGAKPRALYDIYDAIAFNGLGLRVKGQLARSLPSGSRLSGFNSDSPTLNAFALAFFA